MDPTNKSVPLFCLKTTDRSSGRKFYIDFRCTPEVLAPTVEIEETKLVSEICDPSPDIERFKIPLVLGKIYWSEAKSVDQQSTERHYVTTVQMNDKFAYRKVVPSEIIRHYVISVAMSAIEDKFNHPHAKRLYGQFLGYRLELDQAAYEVLNPEDNETKVKQSDELVENKVMFLESLGDESTQNMATDKNSDTGPQQSYDLYYRPKSQILTIQLSTNRLPERIEFNDDRVCMFGVDLAGGAKDSATKLLDIHLPLYIDLSVPVKYKYDDKLCLFRAVFKAREEPAR